MIGVLVNAGAILVGSLVGLLVNKGIPKRFSGAIMTALGLCTIYIGISGALQIENLIVLAVSLVLGVAAGTALKLDDRLNMLGKMIEERFAVSGDGDGDDKPSIAQGFVSASLLFCVGAMAIVGSINSGLLGDHSVIYAKSTLDLIASAMLAVSLGIGVMFSAASVLVYQGLLVLLAQLLRPILDNPAMLAELSGVGSLIIVALGLNLIGVSKVKVADFLPAIVFAPIVFKISELF
jgi:hypothetical protein